MTENIQKPPAWYWVVAAVALVWNLLGVLAYLTQVTMGPEIMEALPSEQRELYENTPVWATAAFAIAVWGGALGSLALLLRKNWADILLMASLAGIIVQNINSFFLTNSWEVFGPGGAVMPVLVIIYAIYMITLAKKAKANGWTS